MKSEAVWNVHINAKLHRDNIHLAKQKKAAPEFTAPVKESISLKRPSAPLKVDPVPPKKIKGELSLVFINLL